MSRIPVPEDNELDERTLAFIGKLPNLNMVRMLARTGIAPEIYQSVSAIFKDDWFAKKLLDSELSRVFHYDSVLKSQMSVSVLSNRIIQIKGHSQRRSLQFILKLIQKISRISFKEWGWEPILLLEVDDKSLLLDELDELSRSLFHEVCSGISQWVQEQREFDFEVESLMQQENYSADIKDTIRRCIYIKSGTRILGNFEILDFLQLRQVKDFIRFKSKFV